MDKLVMSKSDEIIMKLVHYFVTEENYTPVIVKGVKDEIWLENTEAFYKIVRINANYIHNVEQLNYDLFKVNNICKQIKRKTLTWKMRVVNILLDLNEDIEVKDTKNIQTIVIRNISDVKKSSKLAAIFPEIKNNPLNDEKGLDLFIDVTNGINEKTDKKNKDYEEVFKPKKIVVTNVLIGINIACFVLTYLLFYASYGNINLYDMFALDANLVKNGEIYRLITGTFLHAGPIYFPMHLVFNMYSLKIVGSQLENFLGKAKFLVIYFASALMGSLLSCVLTRELSIGASGAVFGLIGSLAYFGYHYRVYFGSVLKTQIIPLIIFNLLLGFCLSGIDNFAHIGGLIGGVLATMGLGLKNKSQVLERVNGVIVYLLLVIFLGFMIVTH